MLAAHRRGADFETHQSTLGFGVLRLWGEDLTANGCPQARLDRGSFDNHGNPRGVRLETDADSLNWPGASHLAGW